MLDFVDARHVCGDAVVADVQVRGPSLRLNYILTHIHIVSYSPLMVHHMWARTGAVIDFEIFIGILLAIVTVWFAIGWILPLFASILCLIRGILAQDLQGQVNQMRIVSARVELLKRLTEGEIFGHSLGQLSWLVKLSDLRWWVASGCVLFHLLLFLHWVMNGPLARP